MTPPDWDDERLAAAFRARFERPAPPNLARAVHGAIAGTSPARFSAPRRGPAWAMAAAAVIVVVVTGIAALGLGDFGRLGGTQSPPPGTAVAATPSGTLETPGATAAEPPDSVLGLKVMSVSQALAVRDAGVDDSEIAVRGWFTPAPPVSCGPAPTTEPVSPLQRRCPTQLTWLAEDAESLVHTTITELTTSAPRSPALNPDLADLDTSWAPTLPQIGKDGGSTPTPVVFVGHFDDRRASLCPSAEVTACRDRFVVDQVAWASGATPPLSVLNLAEPATPRSTIADVEAVIAEEAPQSPILSMVSVDGPQGLATIEPSLRNDQGGLIDQPVLWVVRVLESERISTYIVVDGTDAIYEMNADGEAVWVGGPPGPPTATASAGPWPPSGAVVIALTSQVGAGRAPVQVAVVDGSGRLLGISEKGAVDPATITFDGRFGAYAEPGKPGRVHLTWVGGICDSQITVTVAADLRSIAFDMGPQPDCDSIGVGRQLVLDFSGSVDVPAIELLEAAATPTPVGERDYKLDCGPLGPDTCETTAAQIVAANLKATPAKRVVSIRFTTPCGSFEVMFDDGTGAGADIDCILPPSPG